ncbi:hypothetical protein NDA13_002012 [Ustilago tritici]|nr:hypothetical protein NDA13_002012 [Ustilago tritici]
MEENHYVDTGNQTDSEDEGSKKGEKEAKACRTVGEGVRIDGTGAVLVERDAQTEQSGGQTQVIGVSCPEQVTEGDAHGQAGDAMQPLVLSVGSSFPHQGSIHSTDVEVPSDPAAVAAAQALSIGQTTVGVDRVGNDIEMTDVQAASSKPTSASTQAPSTRGDYQASAQLQVGAPDSDIQAQGTVQAPVAIDGDKENERPTQDNATAAPVATDDNVQFFSFVERNKDAETASALGAMIRSGSNIFGGHSLRSRSPTPSGLLYSAYTPSDQRLHQLLDYLLNLVQNDKMQDELLCKRLLVMCEEFAQEFEQAKKQFEARLANNNEAMYNARISQSLKKDTMRLVKNEMAIPCVFLPTCQQPRLPLAPGSCPFSPAVIDGETTQRQRTPSTRAGSTVGRDRSARAGSVVSNINNATQIRRLRATWEPTNVAPVAGNKVHEVIDDSDDVDDDDTLFLRSRTRASLVTTFTELHD